jgi:4-amino-4-deoxy-L-arabinose transferase-like glycosyltransferase
LTLPGACSYNLVVVFDNRFAVETGAPSGGPEAIEFDSRSSGFGACPHNESGYVSPDRRTILALFSLAFGLRILYAVLVGTNPEIVPNPYTNDFLVARKIAMGAHWWAQPVSPFAPGYQFLLAALFKVGGVHRWLVILVQAMMGGVTAFFVYRIGEKALGRAVGLLSAIWLSIYVPHMHFTSIAVRDVTVTMLLVLLCYVIILYAYRMRGAVWVGVVYALLVHFDPQYLLFFPFVALYFLFCATRHKLLNVQFTFLFLGTVLVLLLPWTYRNARVYGDPIPVGLETTQYVRPLWSVFGGSPELKAPENPEVGPRAAWWYNTVEFWRVAKFRATDSGSANGEPAWSLRHNIASIASYGVLLPFFLAGIWLSLRRRNRAGLVLAAVVVGYYCIRSFYGGSPRARLPIEPMIILLAFYAIVSWYGHYRARAMAGTAGAARAGETTEAA